jgi:phage-related protein (TIGR01555 family)
MTKPHYRMTASGDILPAIRAADGFQNLVARLGTDRDKAAANGYIVPIMTDMDLLNAYRGSSVAKAVVDYPADDACREWREWQGDTKQITDLEVEEKRLGVIAKVRDARIRARLYGGAAIFIGTGEPRADKPLNPDRIQKGGVRYLTVLDRQELGVQQLQMDPSLPGYGKPEMYRLTGGTGQIVDIHPSRLIVFTGDEVPHNSTAQSMHGWGDSVLQTALEKVGHLDGTMANVASLVFEAKVDVIKVKDFTQNLRDGGSAYETLMLKRFGLASTAKGINGAFLLDAEEDYQQKSANFATLPDVMDRFMQMVSAASGIPMTRLFGMSPAGMNATGESDMRNYYDRVKQEQTLDIEPAMQVFDECLIRSALGNRPEELHFNWRSLWQMGEKDQAEVATKLVTAAEGIERMGAASMEAAGKALVNALTEIGAFPGLETAIEEFGEGDPDDIDPETGERVEQEEAMADASPRTLYVRRDVVNADAIIEWAKGQGFKTTLPADDLHVTIAFSRDAVDWMKVGEVWDAEVKVAKGGPRMMERFGDARVLLFASSQLSWRHEEINRAGASWDHPEYQPHITISYDPDAPELSEIEPYTGEIILGPEIFEEVNPKWMEGIKET